VILLREVHAGSSCSFKSGRKFTSSGGEVHVFRKFSQGSSRTEAARFEVMHSVRKFSEGGRTRRVIPVHFFARGSGKKSEIQARKKWCAEATRPRSSTGAFGSNQFRPAKNDENF